MIDIRDQCPNFYACMEYYKIAISKTIEDNKDLSKDELNILLKEKYPNFRIVVDNNQSK
jgi:hypothetical protein